MTKHNKILVVDDEESIRLTLSEFLRREGYDVNQAENASEALALTKVNQYDCIITDIIMPKMTGIELLQAIRVNDQNCRIIIMTGEPTVDTAIQAVQMGANDYLSKPIRKDELLINIKKNCEIKTLIDERNNLLIQNQAYQSNLEVLIEQRTSELKKAMQSIVSLLSHVVEFRDPYTAGHQVRVGNLASEIARKLNYDNEFIESIRVIGYIHDIGKIVIPTEILSKPGKLSEIEYLLLRTHSASGFDMLVNEQLPKNVSEAVNQHHERLDGSGYPKGLKGNDILIEAQILMVADVVEAMSSHRPYRPALGLDHAINEIRNNSGVLYNKEIVNACISLFESDNYHLDDKQYPIHLPI
ncbi:MAG TPA: HD domain-containing phosphohydrolase [Erysipelotrichaceae bacterium]|nr:HD domain-containing phosphohydrolase [Erysipelotrichaceae bacterium]